MMTYLSNTSDRPVIGITLGDFNGIGPEILLKVIIDQKILKNALPVIYGSSKILQKYRKLLNLDDFHLHQATSLENINNKKINVINCWEDDLEIEPGKITSEAGRCAYLSLIKATEDVVSKKIDAIVTCPINKKNIQSSDFNFAGHTEFLTLKAGINDSLMLMVHEGLRVGVITGHIPLHEVKQKLTKEKIYQKIEILHKSLITDFNISKPKIALLGVNPHAGEDGLLGSEEKDIINPLIEELKNKGMLIYGPFSADGFFGGPQYKKFDGILAMYHDQGLIPFKTIAFEYGVNFTAGLPFIRTSPDHGTAYDLAGKNLASETSLREALNLAIDLVKNKKTENA